MTLTVVPLRSSRSSRRTGLLVIHAMALRDKYTARYEEARKCRR
jgi:hypothetical protein